LFFNASPIYQYRLSSNFSKFNINLFSFNLQQTTWLIQKYNVDIFSSLKSDLSGAMLQPLDPAVIASRHVFTANSTNN